MTVKAKAKAMVAAGRMLKAASETLPATVAVATVEKVEKAEKAAGRKP